MSVSCTTRARRDDEIDGRDYFFLSQDEFLTQQARGEFLESAEVYGNYYGTPETAVRDKLAQGINVLLELDVQGAVAIRKKFPDCRLIFVKPPSLEVLAERLNRRGLDQPAVIEERLAAAEAEIKNSRLYDFVVINNDLDQTVEQLKKYVLSQTREIDSPGRDNC